MRNNLLRIRRSVFFAEAPASWLLLLLLGPSQALLLLALFSCQTLLLSAQISLALLPSARGLFLKLQAAPPRILQPRCIRAGRQLGRRPCPSRPRPPLVPRRLGRQGPGFGRARPPAVPAHPQKHQWQRPAYSSRLATDPLPPSACTTRAGRTTLVPVESMAGDPPLRR